MQISGRSILLTGATGGLGRAIASSLARRGARLVLSARDPDALGELASSLPGPGHEVAAADLAEPGAAAALAGRAGDVDVLVANAGLPATGRLEDFTAEQVQRALRVNLESPMLLARALLPGMLGRGAGHLVFVASLSGKIPSPRTSVYNATKFGLRGFALGLRADLSGTGVGSSIVSPGFVREAGMFADSGAKAPPGLGTASPDQVGDAVVRAIENDRVEVAVAPPAQRALAHLGLSSPRLAVLTTSSRAGRKAASDLAAGQVGKR
ncbi:MAG: SDR family NAD(P)-dependent oxidoreductase [Solirubrobacterales bacterium]